MSRSYYYCSAPLAIGLRFFVFGLLFAISAFYAFSLPMWIGALIVLLVLGVWLGTNIGRISGSPSGVLLHVRDLKHNIVLKTPLEYDGWWHYFIAGRSTANDVHAILHVKDSDGHDVYFSERIVIGMRHPNELSYRDEEIPQDALTIKVQRVDRVRKWLERGK